MKLFSVWCHYKTNLYARIVMIVALTTNGRLREFHTGIWHSTRAISTCMSGAIVQQIEITLERVSRYPLWGHYAALCVGGSQVLDFKYVRSGVWTFTMDKNVGLMWRFLLLFTWFWIGKGHDSPENPPPPHQITIRTPLLVPATEIFPEP